MIAERVIDNAPTADVAPVVHGRWEMFNGGYGWKCSACENISFNTHCYCPNCGARMDGEGAQHAGAL